MRLHLRVKECIHEGVNMNTRAMKLSAFIFLTALIIPGLSMAADHCVRPGLTYNGDGSTWGAATSSGGVGAYNALPATLVRGDTYYLADGNYGGYTFDDAVSGSTYIRIKKATVAEHGTHTGWDNSYGESQALFSGTIAFSSDFWEFNGQTGYKKAGYGFKITTTACTSASKLIQLNNGCDDIIVKYVDMQHCGINTGISQDCFYAVASTDGGSRNITVSNCYMHDVNRVMMLLNYITNSTIENCYFWRRQDTVAGTHGEAISMNYCGTNANNTIRHNTFEDIDGTGIIVIKDSIQSHFYIYGNLAFNSSASSTSFSPSQGFATNTNGDTNTYMHVYNNTIANIAGNDTGIRWYCGSSGCTGSNADTNVSYNNLWINTVPLFTGTKHDYNAFSGSTTFGEINAQINLTNSFFVAASFYLAQPTERGITLPPPFHLDVSNTPRGQDGTWDRGAYEHLASGIPRPVPSLKLLTP